MARATPRGNLQSKPLNQHVEHVARLAAAHRPRDRALSRKGVRYRTGRAATSVRVRPKDFRADDRRGRCDISHTAIRRRVHRRQRPCGRDGFVSLGSAARRRATEWLRDVSKSRNQTQARNQSRRSRPACPSSACSSNSMVFPHPLQCSYSLLARFPSGQLSCLLALLPLPMLSSSLSLLSLWPLLSSVSSLLLSLLSLSSLSSLLSLSSSCFPHSQLLPKLLDTLLLFSCLDSTNTSYGRVFFCGDATYHCRPRRAPKAASPVVFPPRARDSPQCDSSAPPRAHRLQHGGAPPSAPGPPR